MVNSCVSKREGKIKKEELSPSYISISPFPWLRGRGIKGNGVAK